MLSRNGIGSILAIFLAVVAFERSAASQSTLFNIPTTDTVAPKKVYVEFDYLPQIPKPEENGRIHTITPRFVAGIISRMEAGANVANFYTSRSSSGGSSTFSQFQPNVKYKFLARDTVGVAAAAGVIWYTPINHRTSADSFGLVYVNFSKKVKSSIYGPRFTLGPYGIVAAGENNSGTRAGAMVGYEQPIHKKITIVADWFSGVSAFGYFTPGVYFALPHNGVFQAGYSIGNDSYKDPGNDNRFLFVYYGITFP